jgi:hypothetical protein
MKAERRCARDSHPAIRASLKPGELSALRVPRAEAVRRVCDILVEATRIGRDLSTEPAV